MTEQETPDVDQAGPEDETEGPEIIPGWCNRCQRVIPEDEWIRGNDPDDPVDDVHVDPNTAYHRMAGE